MMMRTSSAIAVVVLIAGCASRAGTHEPPDPREFGVAVPHMTFTEVGELTAAVAALEAAGVDVSRFTSAAFREGESVAVLIGVPPLRERGDGSFEVAASEPMWSWEQRSSLAEQVLASGPSRWDSSTDDLGTLLVGPWTMIPIGPSCERKRSSKQSVSSDVFYVAAEPIGGLFEVEPALHLLPSKQRVEVLYVERRQYQVMEAVDCFMTKSARPLVGAEI
jgi:hypothetical protein